MSVVCTKSHTLTILEPALLTYAAVLLAALVVPGGGAQVLRRRDPIRAGALSTNWNWLGGLALIPLAGLSTFALTPPTGLTASLAGHLLLGTAITAAALTLLRGLTALFLGMRPHGTALGRDVFITQNTPNVFLWLAITAILAPTTGHHPSVIGLGVALVFFVAVYVDERMPLRAHRRDLSPTGLTAAAGASTQEKTPHAPARADLPLLPSGPGGVQSDSAA